MVQGFVAPINPVEPRRSHVYVYNNIFFSFAADTYVGFFLLLLWCCVWV